ncbi:MAG: thiol oxidoreductase [Thiothrix sp.]|nr:MAG: thiol oxidoreductase [Thiothrix sp.]
MKLAKTLLWGGMLLSPLANSTEPATLDKQLSGGATTVLDKSSNAFSLPANNLSILRRDNFFIGNAFFKQPWVIAPSSTSARDGLGPLFNSNSCQGCHVKDGKGHPPLTREDNFLSTLVRLSIPAETSEQKALLSTLGVVPEPSYGDQIQPNAIPSLKGEATPRFDYEEITGQFKDGETYTLLKPILKLENLNYGALHPQVQMSARVAPVMIGMGLLEAIPEADLLALADPDDKNNDGISGRLNQVWDVKSQKTVVGRFGWKANQPTVEQQSAGAFHGDLGITSPMFANPPCTSSQADCLKAPHGGQPEINQELLEMVSFYASLLAVPARRDVQDPEVLKGERLFKLANCSACHLPELKTGFKPDFPELENQTIQPFTDLLLHDMGEGLADQRPDYLATGSEWRTAPLWGIGLIETVNGHTRFLHDGRARNLMEAILWHEGEAKASRDYVLKLHKDKRTALLRFLNSL